MTIQEWDALLGRLHGHLNNFTEKVVAMVSRELEKQFPSSQVSILQPQLKRSIWDQKDLCAQKVTISVATAAGVSPADLASAADKGKR